MIWVHGSGEQPRLNYGAVVAPLVEDGIAVFSYDKRGVGESEGDCCTSPGKYDLVAADADGAVTGRSIASRDRPRTRSACTARARPVGWCRWRTHD